MPTRNIKSLSSDLTQTLFTAGPRKPILVKDEEDRITLHLKDREHLSEREYIAFGNTDRLQRVVQEAKKYSSKEDPIGVVEAEALYDDVPDVFDLRPTTAQRVTVKIRKQEPARFSFVDEDAPSGWEKEQDGEAA